MVLRFQWSFTDINLVEHQPSFIAAASVLAAYDCKLTQKTVELKTSVISSWGFLEKVCFFIYVNHVMSFYVFVFFFC